jgi:hypothetical protein
MVKIPGLAFSEQVPVETKSQALQIPYLAQYVAAAYRYLVGIAAIAAGIMIVYGGLLYLLGETVGSAIKLLIEAQDRVGLGVQPELPKVIPQEGESFSQYFERVQKAITSQLQKKNSPYQV